MSKSVRMLYVSVFYGALTVFASMLSGSAGAQDLELGEYLAQECASCHQSQSQDGGIPPIHSLDEAEFLEALMDYRDGFRENHAMEMVARSLSEEDMAALAAWFAAQKEK